MVLRHAMRNALLPVVTVIGLEFAFLLGGLLVTEQVFNLNGIGKLMVEAVVAPRLHDDPGVDHADGDRVCADQLLHRPAVRLSGSEDQLLVSDWLATSDARLEAARR